MQTDIRQTSITELNSKISNYSVTSQETDGVSGNGEAKYSNDNFTKWFGYYRSIPELKSAIVSFATWVLGQGYQADIHTTNLLNNIKGWGEDTFLSILWNMLVIKKVNGDSYAEILTHNGKSIDKGGIIINIKPLDPASMDTICNSAGKIIRYEQKSKTKNGEPTIFKPNEIFHLCNDRVADNIHGDSIIEAVQWCIDAKNEAMTDWRRLSHRSSIRILYIDEQDKTRLAELRRDYAEGIKNGEVLILPCKKGDAEFQDLNLPPVEAFLAWIRYLENFFYQALGIPKVTLGGTAENTEASAKVSVIVYEPIFTREILELENDIRSQLGLEIKINKQPSLMDNMQADEAKNTGQTKLEYQGTQ